MQTECACLAGMTDTATALDPADLPDDTPALKAHAGRAVERRGLDLAEEVIAADGIVEAFKRAMFGRRSEKLDPGQLELALEDAGPGDRGGSRRGQDAADATLTGPRASASSAGPTAARCRSICPGSRW